MRPNPLMAMVVMTVINEGPCAIFRPAAGLCTRNAERQSSDTISAGDAFERCRIEDWIDDYRLVIGDFGGEEGRLKHHAKCSDPQSSVIDPKATGPCGGKSYHFPHLGACFPPPRPQSHVERRL